MKNEVVIRNWLMAWFQPDVETEFNTAEKANSRESLTADNFDMFIDTFRDESGGQQFTKDEIELLRGAITDPDHPLAFADGYPVSDAETIRANTVYIIEGGWRQKSSYIGANFWDGGASSRIAVVGRTTGEILNMTEPSLILKMLSSLLIAGINYFVAHHLHVNGQSITENEYDADMTNSKNFNFAIRTLSMTYDSHRYGVITRQGVVTND